MKIKICGLFREEDIDFVNEAKPDFVGFVFAESHRQVSKKNAKKLKNKLDKNILSVGVFVNEGINKIAEICDENIIDFVQLHGDEDDKYISDLKKVCNKKIIKAVKVKNGEEIVRWRNSQADLLMFDAGMGEGKTFDWSLLKSFIRPYFLAGGINESNVEQAIKLNPYCIDISSGVETNKVKDKDKILNIVRRVKMSNTRFGIYGGQYIPETLMNEIKNLEKQYEYYKNNPEFTDELNTLLKNYAGRPSLLYYAENMTKDLGGAKIYLKREDLNHTGSHKINNVLGQVLLAKKMGKTRVIAETGAGQHGVATATAAALLGMECEIFMGEEDTKRQALNVYRMKLLGAKVNAVTSGTKVLKDAVNEAMREWSKRVNDTHYVLGSVMGPHPFPTIVRDFQSVISKEAKQQILEYEKKLPYAVVACVGGGSNAMGMFYNFIEEKNVKLIGCEAAGKGLNTDKHAASIAKGKIGIFHGMKSYFCQDKYGQITEVYSISAGLDYPGIGPEHAYLHDTGRAEYVPITDEEAVSAFEYLARTEGIICAIESAHAVAHVRKIAPKIDKNESIIVCLSGRGDKDVAAIARYRGEKIYE